MEEVHSDGSAVMFLVWWDAGAKVYDVFTCGNGGANPCRLRGTAHWQDGAFINEHDLVIRGTRRKWRDTFSEITPTSFKLAAEMEAGQGEARRTMITTDYRKARR